MVNLQRLLKVGTIHLLHTSIMVGQAWRCLMVTWYLRPMELMLLVSQRFTGLRLTQMLVFQKIQVKRQKSQQNQQNLRHQHHQRLQWKIYLQSQRNQKNLNHQLRQQHLTTLWLRSMWRNQKLQLHQRLQLHQLRKSFQIRWNRKKLKWNGIRIKW